MPILGKCWRVTCLSASGQMTCFDYWTPCRLFKIGLINSSSCWKCKKEMGTFLHLIWECPLVEPFWHSVLKFLETWAGVALPVSPRLCLLGDKTETPTLTKRACPVLMASVTMPGSSFLLQLTLQILKDSKRRTLKDLKV
uniref:Reverse transcriptase zinc-binding domain-containing protein n=1 Tax=Pygocentrus nattereri TaxID=42514 RepID=A0AAR2IK62_PYGNA